MMDKKIRKREVLARHLSRLKAGGKTVVFTNGCFDIIHRGHVAYLKRARSLGDILVVGLNSDASVRAIKGAGRPLNDEVARAEVLSALECVDYVTVFGEATPEALIRKLRPDILVKGADWKVKDIVGGEFVRAYGGRVARIPYLKGYSTTAIIRKMAG